MFVHSIKKNKVQKIVRNIIGITNIFLKIYVCIWIFLQVLLWVTLSEIFLQFFIK